MKDILSKLEASLLNINPTEHTRLNNIARFNSSSFPGAEIARTLINSKYLWEAAAFEGFKFHIATNQPDKLKYLLQKKWKNYPYSLKVLNKKKSNDILNRGNLVFWELRINVKDRFKIIVVEWKKIL
jgi:hypothetical protein